MLSGHSYACINMNFPRIAGAIKLFWRQPEFIPYVDGLLVDTRPGARKGFSLKVTALTNLLARHHADVPRYAPRALESGWSTTRCVEAVSGSSPLPFWLSSELLSVAQLDRASAF